jgi:ATP synthase protein I
VLALDSPMRQNYGARGLQGLQPRYDSSLSSNFEDRGMIEEPDSKKSGAPDHRDEKSEDSLAERLRKLDVRLDGHRESRQRQGERKSDNAGFAAALRLSTEFVSAVLVGAGIGWGIDRFFGVAPWAMIFFLLLGFCAGVINVLRSAGRLSDPHRSDGGKSPVEPANQGRE